MSQSVHPQTARSQLAGRVAATARARGLLRPGDRVLAAVSGGPDSVALLSVLAALAPSWDLTLQAVHVNHGLRGAESDEDASFVAGFCDRLGVALAIERVTLVGPAGRRRGRSLQEQAREARYAAMVRVATALRMDKIALGHTADDQAETLVMWMLRGSGTAGLAGIPPSRGPLVIRPLLDVGRAEIIAYLEAQGLPFRVDSSNAKPLYLRNRVRHELLPILKRFNPQLLARGRLRRGDTPVILCRPRRGRGGGAVWLALAAPSAVAAPAQGPDEGGTQGAGALTPSRRHSHSVTLHGDPRRRPVHDGACGPVLGGRRCVPSAGDARTAKETTRLLCRHEAAPCSAATRTSPGCAGGDPLGGGTSAGSPILCDGRFHTHRDRGAVGSKPEGRRLNSHGAYLRTPDRDARGDACAHQRIGEANHRRLCRQGPDPGRHPQRRVRLLRGPGPCDPHPDAG